MLKTSTLNGMLALSSINNASFQKSSHQLGQVYQKTLLYLGKYPAMKRTVFACIFTSSTPSLMSGTRRPLRT